MRYIRVVTLAVLVLLCIILVLPSVPVQAIDDPDDDPSINAVYVYDLDDGSIGVLIDYTIDYTVLPDETVTEAYLAVFVDTDGVTQLKSVAPYTFVDSGYGRGLVWIDFTADEVATYSLDSADIADYRIWLTGNPTLSWTGDPPKTIGTVDQWNTTGDMSVLLALRVLYYADILELAWTLDMVEETSLGNRLTGNGESYFTNVIIGLRDLAPSCFSDISAYPDYVTIDYDTAFGATATSGTATIVGSPVTLSSGFNTIDTGATTGTIILELADYTYGTITDDGGTVTGSPADLHPGLNILSVTASGTFTVAVAVVDAASIATDTVTGTGLDVTAAADKFGMSRWMLSGIIWMLLSVVVAAALCRSSSLAGSAGGTKTVMLLFIIMLVGGALLGLLHPLVVSLVIIAYGAFIGYVLFFRSDALHKGFMFMMWMFVIVSIAGNIAASGQSSMLTTRLADDITSTETNSIEVVSTTGFPDAGFLVIGDEVIRYPDKDGTHFLDTTFNDIVRGAEDTTAAAHSVRDGVRTKESYLMNASIDYKIATIADSAGALGFIAMPTRLFDLVFTFFKLPLDFLGTDLAILTYIWMVVAVGMVVGLVISLVGGRRV